MTSDCIPSAKVGWTHSASTRALAFAPAWIQKVSYVMPLRYLVTGTADVMARGDGPSAAVLPVVVLLGIAAVLTLAAVRLFRWDEI